MQHWLAFVIGLGVHIYLLYKGINGIVTGRISFSHGDLFGLFKGLGVTYEGKQSVMPSLFVTFLGSVVPFILLFDLAARLITGEFQYAILGPVLILLVATFVAYFILVKKYKS